MARPHTLTNLAEPLEFRTSYRCRGQGPSPRMMVCRTERASSLRRPASPSRCRASRPARPIVARPPGRRFAARRDKRPVPLRWPARPGVLRRRRRAGLARSCQRLAITRQCLAPTSQPSPQDGAGRAFGGSRSHPAIFGETRCSAFPDQGRAYSARPRKSPAARPSFGKGTPYTRGEIRVGDAPCAPAHCGRKARRAHLRSIGRDIRSPGGDHDT